MVLPPEIENFLKYDYAETKDLAKTFLTMVSAVLVFSVTFSEKIIDFAHAKLAPRALLISSWVLLLLATISGGAGLYYISIAAGEALYSRSGAPPLAPFLPPNFTYQDSELRSFRCLAVAGCIFVGGLVALMLAATLSFGSRGGEPQAERLGAGEHLPPSPPRPSAGAPASDKP